MINKKFFQDLKKDFDKKEIERRKIISFSNTVLHSSKRVIFSLHRGDTVVAEKSLADIENILIQKQKDIGMVRLEKEGSYKAAVEEYVEAKMLFIVLSGKKLTKIPKIQLAADSYLGGICDLTGELVRQAVNKASKKKYEEVLQIKDLLDEIMNELVKFDMTGYLRTKYDQVKTSLRKIEQITYDLSLRRKE